jgi:hypothetical protein
MAAGSSSSCRLLEETATTLSDDACLADQNDASHSSSTSLYFSG